MPDEEVDLIRQQRPGIRAQTEIIKGQAQAEQKQLELISQRWHEFGVLQSNGLGIRSMDIEIEREEARNQGNV
jgi:hypothetical protein